MYHDKTIIKSLLVFLFIALSKMAISATIPTVQLRSAALFDAVCSSKDAYKIDNNLVKELESNLPDWQTSWNQEGELLLKTVIEIVGKSFPQNHYTIPLSLCNFPSMSEPLIVNVRYSLRGYIQNPLDTNVTLSTIEHEILHTYIDSFLPKNTPLLKKYYHESPTVLGHLHLFALQKASYLLLGQDQILKTVILKDNSLPNGDYKRAWEIINTEGYMPFVNELKSSK